MSQIGQILALTPGLGVQTITGDIGGPLPPLAGNITLSGGTNIATSGAGSTITINLDGTTNHAIQLGNAGGSISSLGVGATGTVLTGVTGADPAFSATPTVTTMFATTFDTNVAAAGLTLSGTTLSADGTDPNIDINITAKGTGTVIIDELTLTTALAVTEGGTGLSTLTDHAVLLGSGTGAITPMAVGATGEILIGNTGADASWSSTPTVTTMFATTFDTNVAAAGATLSGTTLSVDGTDPNISLNFSSKGAANINFNTDTGYGIVFDGITTGWASSQYHTIQKTVQTTDSTPTIIHSIPLSNSVMITVNAMINGIQDDKTDVVGGMALVTAYRTVAGNIALVGSPFLNRNYSNPSDSSDIDCIVNVGTQSLDIMVIGVAAQNWNWASTITYMTTVDQT